MNGDDTRQIVETQMQSSHKLYRRVLLIINICSIVAIILLIVVSIWVHLPLINVGVFLAIIGFLYAIFAGNAVRLDRLVRGPITSVVEVRITGQLIAVPIRNAPRIRVGEGPRVNYFGSSGSLGFRLVTMLGPYSGRDVCLDYLCINGRTVFPLRFGLPDGTTIDTLSLG